jgi:alpha-tubulin suppressor-like RCC1 family protein
MVGVGIATACAATADKVLCWGSNADGQLRPLTETRADDGRPRVISLGSDSPVRALAVGRATFVLHDDGGLETWGANPPLGRVSPILPDPFPQSLALAGFEAVDLVHDNACATAGGIGYCWGAPVPAKSASALERALPEPVVAPEPIAQIATTRAYVIEDIGVQRYRWCGVSTTGALYCWGLNDSGQAGDGTQDYAFDAVKVDLPAGVSQVRTTPNTTCALLTTGKVHCWGSNYNGQLGNGQSRGRSLVPVEVMLP